MRRLAAFLLIFSLTFAQVVQAYSLTYQGSTLHGKGIKLNSGGDLVLQASDVRAGPSTGSGQATGGITIDAGGDIKLLAAADQHSRTHTEKLQTDGYLIQADGAVDGNTDRRINNKAEEQTVTNKVTKLVSGGDITTHSGGDTTLEATILDALGGIDMSATGYAAGIGSDGKPYEGREGKIIFKSVKDSTYVNVEKKQNSDVWQSMSGHGEVTETLKLANIKTGKGLKVDAKGGIEVDISEVPKEAPAPVEPEAPLPTTGADGKPITQKELAAIKAQRAAQAAEKAAQAEATRRVREEQRFNDHIQQLAGKPGQEWIGQLAKMAKDKPDSVKLRQVNAALEKWDYSHGGMTPEATAVVVIVVTYFTAGAASGAGASVAGATGSAVAGAAVTAAVSTLASQAAVALLNNKGNIGKTLDDMGRSENVKALVTAMITAGVLQGIGQNIDVNGVKLSDISAKSSFTMQLEKNLINQASSAVINHAINGGDLQQQLEQSFKSAFIDTGAAQSANWIGDMKADGTLNVFTHKLAHAVAGCAVGAAKANDCSSGAQGAVVGELAAEWYGGNRTNGGNVNQPGFQTDTVNFAKMMAGIAVAITGGDANAINLAAATAGNAAENNYLNHKQVDQFGQELADCQKRGCSDNEQRKIALKWKAKSDQQQDEFMQEAIDTGSEPNPKALYYALKVPFSTEIENSAAQDIIGEIDSQNSTVKWTSISELAALGFGGATAFKGNVGTSNSAASKAGASGVPQQLLSGQAAEAGQLAAINSSGKVPFTPTPEQANSAAFRVIVGQPKYTPNGELVGTIYDGLNASGLVELKNGSSPLNSSYQVRLETYGSLINDTPFTIYTSRPVNTTFSQWLTNWGVNTQPLPKSK